MATTHSELTAGERRYLVHFGQAQSRGLTLAQYCRAQGLNAQSLYNISSQLRRKRSRPETSFAVVARKPERARRFVAVWGAPPPSSVVGGWRMYPPPGWVSESPGLPESAVALALVA